jgi:hypothetical protein
MLRQTAHGLRETCLVVGDLVRETPKFYVFRHPWFTAGEERRVSQLSGYHVEPCRYCPRTPS